MTVQKCKVLIVEDVREISRQLQKNIEANAQFEVCGSVRSIREATSTLQKTRPRLILVDLGLPDGSGIEIIHAVRNADWTCDCMVISVFGDEVRVLSALQAGAKGYLLKGDTQPEISEVLEAVLQGGSPISPKVARHLLSLAENGSTSALNGGDVDIKLTTRETEILRAVKRGLKRKEIARVLDISIGTVGIHINKIYRKLEVGSNVEAILAASRQGLL